MLIGSINHPLEALAQRIRLVITKQDSEAMAHLLMGEQVPTLSREGDDPADVIWLCMSRYMQPQGPGWFDALAKVLADLTNQLADLIANGFQVQAQANGPAYSPQSWGAFSSGAIESWSRHEPYVYNLLLLSSYVPARPVLFSALRRVYSTGLERESILDSRAIPMLQTAVISQQTDTSLVETWHERLSIACKELYSSSHRAEALTWWRALVIAPSGVDDELDIKRLQRALNKILQDSNASEPGRVVLAHTALEQLLGIWAGTAEYWRGVFNSESNWSSIIRELAADIWPAESDPDQLISGDDLVFWHQLDIGVRVAIRKAFTSKDSVWSMTFFSLYEVRVESDAHLDRAKLLSLQTVLQRSRPALHISQGELELLASEDDQARAAERNAKAPVLLSRFEQFGRVTRQISDIERLLAHGSSNEALRRFEELKSQQKLWANDRHTEPGANDQFRAKTSANVAALFLQFGYGEFAKKLYEEAREEFPADVVILNGLADVMKGLARYAEAEALYRTAIAEFPDDDFARCGLAEVLKDLGRYADAEALYRATMAEFPSDAVARNGLAEVLKDLGRYADAEALYRATMAEFPYNAVARNGLANTLRKLSRLDEAESLLLDAVSANLVQQRMDGVVLALISVSRGENTKALDRIRSLVADHALDLQSARLRALAASIELRTSRPQEAAEILDLVSVPNEAVRVVRWHAELANAANLGGTAIVSGEIVLNLISERARRVKQQIEKLLSAGLSLCENDELFAEECELLAA